MCLTRLEKFNTPKVGYKTFILDNGKLYTSKELLTVKPRNRWLKAKEHRDGYGREVLSLDLITCYYNGWHVFVNRIDAEYYACEDDVVLKVAVRKVRDTGIQRFMGFSGRTENLKVMVVEEIKIFPKGEQDGT